MKASFFLPMAIAMGLMLSPESLILLGSGIGGSGIFFLGAIVVAAAVQIYTALSYGAAAKLCSGAGCESYVIHRALGPVAATVFPVASRVVFAVCAMPIVLSTAGFVFNEVFLYWFPNFAFAYGMLGLLFAVNLAGPALAVRVQLALVLVSIAGLVFLSVAGLAGLGAPRAELGQQGASPGVRHAMLGLLLFVGLDLAVFAGGEHRRGLAWPMALAVAAGGIVFCLWGYVSLMYVPLQKLSETTIPYTVAAREVLGDAGRKIMGVVVISGVAAAVNAILLCVSSMVSAMADRDYLPRFLGFRGGRAVVPLIALTAGGAGMMAAGMAGEPRLLLYARGAMLLWLLNYAVLHLSILRLEGIHELRLPGYPLVAVLGFLATGAAVLYLAWTDGERLELLKFMLNVLVVIYVAGLLWTALKKMGAPRAG